MTDKLDLLKNRLQSLGKAAVAFSGGVDSTFLLKIAKDVLGENVIAVTAISAVQIEDEMDETRAICADIGVEQVIIQTNEMEVEDYISNPFNRCYHCKNILYKEIIEAAEARGINYILDGTNADDLNDYRPGLKALDELKIISPLKEVDFTKEEIRELSVKLNLKTSSKPSMPCLASRIPYGTRITEDKLRRIDKAESFLRSNGFIQVRVRDHEEIARIEIEPDKLIHFFNNDFHKQVSEKFKEFGYSYIALDIDGYKMGSLNKKVLANGYK